MQVTKVSDLTATNVAEYLRLIDPSTDDTNTLTTLLNIAKSYVQEYTGKTAEQIDEHADIVIAVLVLCQDMWDNRSLYVDESNVNKVVESILGLHSENLL